jgi:hypothetical protein
MSLGIIVVKFILIIFIIGLGVHFGIFVPRGSYTSNFSGIFGAAYVDVVKITIFFFLIYRILQNARRIRVRSDIKNAEMADQSTSPKYKELLGFVIRELILLVVVLVPICIGIILTITPMNSDDLLFILLRYSSMFLIVASIGVIYIE